MVLDRDKFGLELDYRSIMHITVKVPSLELRLRHENGADTSEGADSVTWDGGVSFMVGLGLRSSSDHAPTRPH